MKFNYKEPSYIDKENYLAAVGSGNSMEICAATINAVHYINDYDWLVNQLALSIVHNETEIRGVTVTCIGHLARLYEDANREALLALLTPLKNDEELSGRVQDAIDDINTYLKNKML